MKFDPYITTEEDLVAIVQACMTVFKGGGESLSTWTNEGTSVGLITRTELTKELYDAAIACLKQMKPEIYGYVHKKTRPYRGRGWY